MLITVIFDKSVDQFIDPIRHSVEQHFFLYNDGKKVPG